MLVLILRTHNIMIFGGMNGKLPSKISFWKWISCAEGENEKMGIPNYRERSQLNKSFCKQWNYWWHPRSCIVHHTVVSRIKHLLWFHNLKQPNFWFTLGLYYRYIDLKQNNFVNENKNSFTAVKIPKDKHFLQQNIIALLQGGFNFRYWLIASNYNWRPKNLAVWLDDTSFWLITWNFVY